MSGIRTASTARPWTGAALVALLVALLVAGACGPPKVSKRQTDIMEKAGTVSVSAALLRVGVNDLVDRFAGRIEQSADRIVEQSDAVAVQRRALALKVDAIPVVYTAGYRADPLSAAVDVWVLAFQFREYVETGAGRAAFGPQQGLLQEAARVQLADVDAVMRTIAIKPEYFDRARPQVEQWAAGHPIEHSFAGRTSGASLLTRLRSENQDVFLVVGAVSDTLENMSERLNTYAAHLPKQARWQAELLASEMTTGLHLDRTIADVHDVGTAARHATGVLEGIPALLDAERDIIAAERRAVLAGVDGQRLQTLAVLKEYVHRRAPRARNGGPRRAHGDGGSRPAGAAGDDCRSRNDAETDGRLVADRPAGSRRLHDLAGGDAGRRPDAPRGGAGGRCRAADQRPRQGRWSPMGTTAASH